MIRGLGIDLCEIRRMEDALTHPRFFERVFSARERDYIQSRNKLAGQTAAGLFAAKEAFVKALGTGITSLDFHEIEILHDDSGAPYYMLGEKQKEQLSVRRADAAFVSITHENGMAAAVCVLEGC